MKKARSVQTEAGDRKVRVTMYVDADVLRYFKTRADEPGAQPYQTQMNAALRQVMECPAGGSGATGAATADELLQDKAFIKAVARQVKKRLGNHRHE